MSDQASDYLTELTKNGPVELKIYGHQVGGHSLLMKIGNAICKPLLPREHWFYTYVPQELKAFTPVYHGAISVRFSQSEDGRIHLMAIPAVREREEDDKGNRGERRGERKEEEEEEEEGVGPLFLSQPIGRLQLLKASSSFSNGSEEMIVKEKDGVFTNPWSTACMENVQALLANFDAKELQQMHQDYLVLEDLTSKYAHPCVLDLKIGMRQYGDEQSEEKKEKHKARCASSTSFILGVRICGMQIYDAVRHQYRYRDKYYGRELDVDGFYQALSEFLHNGICRRCDIIPTLVKMLTDLKQIIEKQDSYRFFSSSLLVIYDGSKVPDWDLGQDSKVSDWHLGQGSKVSHWHLEQESLLCSKGRGSTVSRGRGSTVSRGEGPGQGGSVQNGRKLNRTLSDLSTSLAADRQKRCRENGTFSDTASERNLLQVDSNGIFNLSLARGLVDVRMIDFAHSTSKEFQLDSVQYSGPDEGYVLGLQTLIGAFQDLLPTCTSVAMGTVATGNAGRESAGSSRGHPQ